MTQPTSQPSFVEPVTGGAAYQEELQLPRAWFALIALPAFVAIVRRRTASRDGGKGMPTVRVVAQTAISAALLCYFSTLRIVVQGGTLTIGFRRLAESIPLQRITSCEPTTYHWLAWGGYGVRIHPHARMYNLPSDRGRVVRLTLDDGREVSFSSADPDAVCAAIHTGQSALAA
jgi:hypothetical protein